MENLTHIEKINLLAFLKTMINKESTSENLKKEMTPIYLKIERNFKRNG